MCAGMLVLDAFVDLVRLRHVLSTFHQRRRLLLSTKEGLSCVVLFLLASAYRVHVLADDIGLICDKELGLRYRSWI